LTQFLGVLLHLVHLAGAEKRVRHLPVVVEGHGLDAFYDLDHLVVGGAGADQEHLASAGAVLLDVEATALGMAVVHGVDAELFGVAQGLHHALRGVPLAHQLVEQRVEVRVAVELVLAKDQAADLMLAEPDLGKSGGRGLLGGARGNRGAERGSQTGRGLEKVAAVIHK
jgi:hypothetical protein